MPRPSNEPLGPGDRPGSPPPCARDAPASLPALAQAALATSTTTSLIVESLLEQHGVTLTHRCGIPACVQAHLAYHAHSLIGLIDGWGPDQYAELTAPWRSLLGDLRTGDGDIIDDPADLSEQQLTILREDAARTLSSFAEESGLR